MPTGNLARATARAPWRALVVHKYGGTSLADVDRVRHAAGRVAAVAAGQRVVVVVSAQGDTTDRLLAQGCAFDVPDGSREMDQLLATGETASAALMALALRERGLEAESLTGAQAGVRTHGRHGAGVVDRLAPSRVHQLLGRRAVPVVTGYQGVDERGDTVTLGRGGSDTTAVALAAGLGADRCEIYTDVPGVFSADPRIVPAPRLLPLVPVDVMAEMAFTGARVLHSRAVELAQTHQVTTHVLGAATEGPGTVIPTDMPCPEQQEDLIRALETAPVVTAVTHDPDVSRVLVHCAGSGRDPAPEVLSLLAEYGLPVDLVARSGPYEDEFRMGFATRRSELARVRRPLERLVRELGGEVRFQGEVGKVTVVGTGLLNRPEVTARMLTALAASGTPTTWIHTSQVRTSALVPQDRLTDAVRVLHTAFGLDLTEETDPAAEPAPEIAR
ncbi:aspartate kinase [Streptomyces sp. NPDC003077]|uniref:aspartate kinase n=1 Tax=Streptomyces sp. NPDC003077 TaxID=3154443 RepID=UPI0033A75D49